MSALRVGAVERIKASVTIQDIAARLCPGWTAGKACKSPFREDKNASFSVFDGGSRWKDFSTGEGGDAIDFFCKATGKSAAEAIKELSAWAGLERAPAARKPAPAPLRLPELRKGTADELGALSRLRNLSIEGLRLAQDRGLLWFADVLDEGRNVPCWVVTDSKRVSAQARRLDGQPMTTKDGNRIKAKTLPGSRQSWPIGLPECSPFKRVLLVEGGPDLLAAHHFIVAEGQQDQVGVVAMLGASNRIPAEALPMFAGKSVRIFPHLDPAGQKAAALWEGQLKAAGAVAHCFDLAGLSMTNGKAVGDLNDVCHITAEAFESERDLWALATWEVRP